MNSGSTTHQKKKLLTTQQAAICKHIAGLGIELVSKRASALLVLNEGSTQAVAAEKSGLTTGQVRYLMVIFRKNGMAIFPADLLEKAKKSISKKAPNTKDTVKTKKASKARSKKDKPKKKKSNKKKSTKAEDKKKKKQKAKKKAKNKRKNKKKK